MRVREGPLVGLLQRLRRGTIPRARARALTFSRSLLRSAKILLQNRAILRNAGRITLPLLGSGKQAAQHLEKLRKSPSLNYESPALTAELQARHALD